MNPEVLAYPFLFVAIFFESFVLVTLLSGPAARARSRTHSLATPSVAMIVPCYNEASRLTRTVESLLALDYPREKLSVMVVDDGSSDGTRTSMERFRDNPQVTLIYKENGGKYTALNAGIAATEAELVGCLDADSFVEPDALKEMIPCFDNPRVAAATPAMSVFAPGNLLQHMQNAEYIFGITLRHALSSVNGLYVTPGPFSLYRHSIIKKVGGFRHGHAAEDMEMALRLQQAGYIIENAPRARVYTKAPRTLSRLLKQRTRWTTGFMRNILNEYRGLVGSPRYGALGTIVLPVAVLAIVSGMLLFTLSALMLVGRAYAAVAMRGGVPFQYAWMPHVSGVDWFYLPGSVYALLGVIAVGTALGIILVGKRLSQTPGSITLGLLSYLFLYGIVAPLWLIRATTDVVTGRRRSWR